MMNSISEEVQQQVLSKMCSVHGKITNLIFIGSSRSQRRLCSKCIEQQNIPEEQTIDIKDIFRFDPSMSSSLFGHYQDEKISSMLIQMTIQEKRMRFKMKSFFNEFYSEMKKAFEKIVREYALIADSLSNIVIESYTHQNEEDKVLKLKKILLEQKPTEEQELQQCILEWNQQTYASVSNRYEKAKQIYSSCSTLQTDNITKDIIKLIESINLFPTNSIQNASLQQQSNAPPIMNIDPYQLPLPFTSIQNQSSLSNQQPSFINSSLQPQFMQIVNPQYQSNAPIINFNPFQQSPFSANNPQFPVYNPSLPSNNQQFPVNYPSIPAYDSSHEFSNRFQQPINNNINNPQPNNYQTKKTEDSQLVSQPQFNPIWNYVVINRDAKKQEKQAYNSEIKLSKKSFVPSTSILVSQKKMKIEFNSKSNEVTIVNTSNRHERCYLNQKLSQYSNYIISLACNYKQKKTTQSTFGLISQPNKNYYQDDNIYFTLNDGGKSNKIIKGTNLKFDNETKFVFDSYLIHINISQKIFRICSPNYNNCQELDDPNYFDINKEYSFFIQLSNEHDTAIVKKIQMVTEFPKIEL